MVRSPSCRPRSSVLVWAFRVILTLLVALVASTCTSSESHIGKTKSFLAECSADAPCADPEQSCFCFCTVACESNDPCIAELERLGLTVDPTRISCRAPSCEAASDGQPADVTGICDVSCESDADCGIFSDEHRCLGGYCRLEEVVGTPGAERCPQDTAFVPGDGTDNPSDLCMDRYEVTAFAYRGCVDAGVCSEPIQGNLHTVDQDDHPMQFMTREEAETYCAYVGRRLPTRGEWQWVAQNGAAMEEFPWGSSPLTENDARVCAPTVDPNTCPIGSHPTGENAQGVADLVGNVAELVDDAGTWCAAGGGFQTPLDGLTPTSCEPFTVAAVDVGFRCVVAPSPP